MPTSEDEILKMEANPFLIWREAAGLSQREAGLKIGVSRFLVSMWERCVCAPTERDHVAVAKGYGITVDEVIAGVRWVWAHKKPPPDTTDHPLRRPK